MVELRYIICNQEGLRSVWFAERKFISALCEFRQYGTAGHTSITKKRTFETAKERGEGLLLEVFVEHDEDVVARARLGIDEASEGEDGCGEGA